MLLAALAEESDLGLLGGLVCPAVSLLPPPPLLLLLLADLDMYREGSSNEAVGYSAPSR